jgi:hydroxyacylglutathione hydrolase
MPKISPIPAFRDNYLWMIQHAGENWIVDPGDAAPVKSWLEQHQLQLDGILITHHHPDHIGGVEQLNRPGLRIIGPALDAMPFTTEPVSGDETISAAGMNFKVIAVPGHTLNHLAYYCGDADSPILFCGDTLFVGGCGRLFEGTPEQMLESLNKLAALPDDTRVYCAHEYTQANLRFALSIEPHNQILANFSHQVAELRQQNQPTVPSTVAQEKRINPFMRSEDKTLKEKVAARSGRDKISNQQCFTFLRSWKDEF